MKIGFWITWLLNRLQVLMGSSLAVSLGWGGGSCFLNRRGLLSLLRKKRSFVFLPPWPLGPSVMLRFSLLPYPTPLYLHENKIEQTTRHPHLQLYFFRNNSPLIFRLHGPRSLTKRREPLRNRPTPRSHHGDLPLAPGMGATLAQCQGCSGREGGAAAQWSALRNGHSFRCRWRGGHAGRQLGGRAWRPDLARAPDRPCLPPRRAPPDL